MCWHIWQVPCYDLAVVRRLIFSYTTVIALTWLALGVWAYGLEREPASPLFGVHWLPVSKSAAALKACK
jgi:hypothetical protein